MATLHELLDTPDRFEEWIKSHDPKEVAGLACKSYRCPVAEFVRDNVDLRPGDTVSLTEYSSTVSGSGRYEYMDNPMWVYHLVQAVDKSKSGTRLTFGQVRYRLRKVLKQLAKEHNERMI